MSIQIILPFEAFPKRAPCQHAEEGSIVRVHFHVPTKIFGVGERFEAVLFLTLVRLQVALCMLSAAPGRQHVDGAEE